MLDKENTIGIVIIGLLLIYALTSKGTSDEVKEKILHKEDKQITDVLFIDDKDKTNTLNDYDYRIKNIFVQAFK